MSNKRFIGAAGIASVACLVLLAGASRAEDGMWMTDYAAAKAKAKAENKLLFIDFTGSDWCGWCIKLHNEVFDLPAFKAEAPKKYVFVELDFPNKKVLPPELKSQNQKLQQEFKVHSFPSIFLADAEGRAFARTGYRAGGPEKYLTELDGFVVAHADVMKMQAKLTDAKGLDRAKVLDEILVAQEKLGMPSDDEAKFTTEILALDADGKAGLKAKYTVKSLLADAAKLASEGKFDDAKAACEKAVAVPGVTGEQKMDAYFAEGNYAFQLKDFSGVVSNLKKGKAAAPESPKAAQIDAMVARFSEIADMQSSVAKLKADADAAKGVERAKLLDQLIEAQIKFNTASQARRPSPEIDTWMAEIITLDADGKAGLKGKYEFKLVYAEATKLFRAKEYDKADATLTKALAMVGVTEEQKATAEKLKAAINAQKTKGAAPPATK